MVEESLLMGNHVEEDIGREQVRLAMQHVPTLQAATLVVAMVLSYAVWGDVSGSSILAFNLSVSAVAAIRVVLHFRFLKVRNEPFAARNWKRTYLLLSLISGIVWGGSAFLILPLGNPWFLALFVIVVASMSVSSTIFHSSVKWAPAAFIASAMLPYAVRCFMDGGEQVTLLAFLIVLYTIVMLSYSHKHHGTIASSIALRFENLNLVEEVRRNEERFRLIFQRHNAVMLLVEPDTGGIVDANRSAERFYGYALTQLRRMRMEEINMLPPEEIRSAWRQALEGKRNCFEFPHRIASGEIRIVETHSSPVKVREQTLLFCIIHDINERKRAEKELKESEERLVEAQKVARLGYYSLDVSTGVWTSSAILDDIFGIGKGYRRDVEGWSLLVHPDERRSMLDYLRADVLEKRNPFDREYRIVRPSDQGVRWVHGLGDVEYDPDGKPVIMIGTIQDVTDRKRTEEEKERLQEQLQQAMKMEAVGRLAGGVAHDFNNILTAIIGNISLVQTKLSPSDPAVDRLVEATKAAERAAMLTQQLLGFSRRQIIEPKVLDLNILIADLSRMLIRIIGENIVLKTVPGGSLGPVKVDSGQIEQTLVNLVVNARDAMPDGGTLLIETANVDLNDEHCALHPDVRPGRFVMLVVSDTGHGMSEEVRKQIFEPFFTTKPKGTGTGLGLAMAYGVVKQSGGSIEVYSEVGKGTTFKIYLPRDEGEAARPKEVDPRTELRGGSETVLLAEDEDCVRNLAVQFLGNLGYRVLEALDGATAIALATTHPERIDLLMTDVVMPGMSGGQLAERLREIHQETKVLFTSGYTEDAIVHHGVLDDGVSFIGKPYSLSALARKVREVLDKE